MYLWVCFTPEVGEIGRIYLQILKQKIRKGSKMTQKGKGIKSKKKKEGRSKFEKMGKGSKSGAYFILRHLK